jgi:hypothetical protein
MRDGSAAQQGGEGGERKKAPKKKKNAAAGENGSVGGDEPAGRRSPRSSDGTRNTGGKTGAQTSDAASSKGSKPVKKGPNFNMEADFPTLGDDFPGMAVGGSMVEVEATQGDAPTLAPAPAATVPVATQTSPKSAAQGAWAAAVLGGKEKPEGDAGLPEATPISTKGTQTSASTKSAETQSKSSEASDVSFGGVRAAKTQTKDGNGNGSRQSTPSSAGDAASKSANKAENAKQVSVPVTFGSFDETTPDTTKVEAAGDVPSNPNSTDAGGSVSVWGMKKSFSDVLKQAGRN